MKLMVIILNKLDALEYLLEGLSAAGIGGATIIESSGLVMTLSKLDSSFVSASIRSLFSSDANEDNRTIISVIRNDQLEIARKVIYSTVGDLSMPNTGILFTLPIDFAEGIRKNRGPIMSTAAEINEAAESKGADTGANPNTNPNTNTKTKKKKGKNNKSKADADDVESEAAADGGTESAGSNK